MKGVRQVAIIDQVYKGGSFSGHLQNNPEHALLLTLCGQMRKARIVLVQGDRVDVELSVYDLTRGRIVWRHNAN